MYKLGQKVYTGVFIGRQWVRGAMGIVVDRHNGYDVDISLHGGAPWIVQADHLEVVKEREEEEQCRSRS